MSRRSACVIGARLRRRRWGRVQAVAAARRCIAGVDLPIIDSLTDEHRLVDDAFLADLWKAYKKCLKNNRTGPAGQLLKEIEDRLIN